MATLSNNKVDVQQRTKVPRHSVYHLLRTEMEAYHRYKIMRETARVAQWPGVPYLSIESIPKSMRIAQIEACCNKSAPIYILWNIDYVEESWKLLSILLHNYLYNMWFQPYRSEIDWGQFLAQTIIAYPIPRLLMASASPQPAGMAQYAASLSQAICAHVKSAEQKIGSRTYPIEQSERPALLKEIGPGACDFEPIEDPTFLVLQPLFHAVSIVIRGGDFSAFTEDISQIPVLIVLTGIDEGLSAPITFDHIVDHVVVHHDQATDSVQFAESTLSTAAGFLMDLEQRELNAFGPRPDPRKETRRSLFDRYLSWSPQFDGGTAADVPEGPSSTWVDTNIYKEWTGEGAENAEAMARGNEKRYRRLAQAIARGENPYYHIFP